MTETDGFKSRLKTIIGRQSVNSFAKNCDIPESSLRNYLSSDSLPKAENLVKIARAAGVSLDWLILGIGNGCENQLSSSSAFDEEAVLDEYRLTNESTVALFERTPARSQAMALPAQFMATLAADPEHLRLIRLEIYAQSRFGGFWNYALVDKSIKRIAGEGFFLIGFDGFITVRYAQRRPGAIIFSKVEADADTFSIACNTDEEKNLEVVARIVAIIGTTNR
ncbi:MAG TPA: helix-turn-helix domain-containing protein [Candidatus Rifleibacterium sp.]|nr:helix-turn-helix domain-containing protein [Candidatus Rifleibacterium sp.]